jgi:hypothetical protein
LVSPGSIVEDKRKATPLEAAWFLALARIGKCQAALRKTADARATFEKVRSDYPDSVCAALAKSELKMFPTCGSVFMNPCAKDSK